MSIVDMDAHPSRYIYKQTAGNFYQQIKVKSRDRTQEDACGDPRGADHRGPASCGVTGLCAVGTPEIATEAYHGGDAPPLQAMLLIYSAMWWRLGARRWAWMATLVAALGGAPADAIRAVSMPA